MALYHLPSSEVLQHEGHFRMTMKKSKKGCLMKVNEKLQNNYITTATELARAAVRYNASA
jgi:hypothetical protein